MVQVKVQQRIEWLIENKSLWEGFPDSTWDMLHNKEAQAKELKIIKLMKDAGLYSDTTHDFDIKLVRVINQARKELRSR